MNRRAEPIGTLDDLLAAKVEEFHEVDAQIARHMSQHADVIRELEQLRKQRLDARDEALRTQKSILKLGYAVSEKSVEGLQESSPHSDLMRLYDERDRIEVLL